MSEDPPLEKKRRQNKKDQENCRANKDKRWEAIRSAEALVAKKKSEAEANFIEANAQKSAVLKLKEHFKEIQPAHCSGCGSLLPPHSCQMCHLPVQRTFLPIISTDYGGTSYRVSSASTSAQAALLRNSRPLNTAPASEQYQRASAPSTTMGNMMWNPSQSQIAYRMVRHEVCPPINEVDINNCHIHLRDNIAGNEYILRSAVSLNASEHFYFEVTVGDSVDWIGCIESGYRPNAYKYLSSGYYESTTNRRINMDRNIFTKEGDVFGFGVHKIDTKLFFTKNGALIDSLQFGSDGESLLSTVPLFAAICLSKPGVTVEVNFEKPFKFDLDYYYFITEQIVQLRDNDWLTEWHSLPMPTTELPTFLNNSPDHCADGISILSNEPNKIVFLGRGDDAFMAVRANTPIPSHCDYFYFEMTVRQRIFKSCHGIAFGLSVEDTPLRRILGSTRGSYAYSSNGSMYEDGVRVRCGNEPAESNKPYSRYIDDRVVGCAVDRANKRVYFYRGEELLKDYTCKLDITDGLYPTFSVYTLSVHTEPVVISVDFSQPLKHQQLNVE